MYDRWLLTMLLAPSLSPAAMALEAYSLSWYVRRLLPLPTGKRESVRGSQGLNAAGVVMREANPEP